MLSDNGISLVSCTMKYVFRPVRIEEEEIQCNNISQNKIISKINKSTPRTPKFYVENPNQEKPRATITGKIHYVFGEYKMISK